MVVDNPAPKSPSAIKMPPATVTSFGPIRSMMRPPKIIVTGHMALATLKIIDNSPAVTVVPRVCDICAALAGEKTLQA